MPEDIVDRLRAGADRVKVAAENSLKDEKLILMAQYRLEEAAAYIEDQRKRAQQDRNTLAAKVSGEIYRSAAVLRPEELAYAIAALIINGNTK